MPKHSGDHHGRRRLAAFIVAVLAVAIAFFGGFLSYHAIKPTTGDHGTHLAAVGAAHDRLNASVPTLSPDEVEKAKHGHTYRDFRIVKRADAFDDPRVRPLVEEGDFLYKLQGTTKEVAATVLEACGRPVSNAIGKNTQSIHTLYESLAVNGWTETLAPPPTSNPSFMRLTGALTELGLSTKEQDNVRKTFAHNKLVDLSGDTDGILRIDAIYDNVYNVRDGVIIAIQNTGSEEKIDSPLHQWSDVAFLKYQLEASKFDADMNDLQYVFLLACNTKETRSVVSLALGGPFDDPEKQAPQWVQRKTFESNGDPTDANAFKALIATPHGRRIAWLLIQHQDQFGYKRVARITVFRRPSPLSEGYAGPDLLFELEDVVPRSDFDDGTTWYKADQK